MNIKKGHALIADFLFLITVVVFVEYLCHDYSCYSLESTVTEPLFYAFAGLVPTLSYLMLFDQQIFYSWTKQVASWFLPLTLILVASVDEGQGLFPLSSNGRNDTVILMMAILFIITLVYAPIMNRKYKKRSLGG